MQFKLYRSPAANKKYRVVLPNGLNIDFGDSRYEDYTMHKDPRRKASGLVGYYGISQVYLSRI